MLVPVYSSIAMQYDGGSICDAKLESITVREALQRYGEEMRQKNKLHWIEALFEKMHDIARRWTHWQDPVFVIDDVRRINEARVRARLLRRHAVQDRNIPRLAGWQVRRPHQ